MTLSGSCVLSDMVDFSAAPAVPPSVALEYLNDGVGRTRAPALYLNLYDDVPEWLWKFDTFRPAAFWTAFHDKERVNQEINTRAVLKLLQKNAEGLFIEGFDDKEKINGPASRWAFCARRAYTLDVPREIRLLGAPGYLSCADRGYIKCGVLCWRPT